MSLNIKEAAVTVLGYWVLYFVNYSW